MGIEGLASSRSFMDSERVNGFKSEEKQEDFQPSLRFNNLRFMGDPLDLRAMPPEPARSMFEEARQFWSDALRPRSASPFTGLACLSPASCKVGFCLTRRREKTDVPQQKPRTVEMYFTAEGGPDQDRPF